MKLLLTIDGVSYPLREASLRVDRNAHQLQASVIGSVPALDAAIVLWIELDAVLVVLFSGRLDARGQSDGRISLQASAAAIASAATWPSPPLLYQSGARARVPAVPWIKPGDQVGDLRVAEVVTTLSAESPWITEVLYG